jgi:serine/threonine-protein kinase
MPFARGGSLAGELRAGLSPARALDVLRGVASALDGAHAEGVLHRDLKLSNVLFDEKGRPLVSDFGTARLYECLGGPDAGLLLGAPATVAPEVAQGRAATPASDRYSFAALAYHVLAREMPFVGSPLSIVHQHASVHAPPIRTKAPALPDGLDDVFERALSKDPEARPASCRELVRALAALFPEAQRDLLAEAPLVRGEAREISFEASSAPMPEPKNPFARANPPVELASETFRPSPGPVPEAPRRRSYARVLVPVLLGGLVAVGALLAVGRSEPRGARPASTPVPSARRVEAEATKPFEPSSEQKSAPARPVDKREPSAEAAARAPAGGASLAGRWRIDNVVQTSSYGPYRGLRVGYLVKLTASGDRIKGEGEKWLENGREIPTSSRTPIKIFGTVKGSSVEAVFVENGRKRQTSGRFHWSVRESGRALSGRFGSSASGSSGSSSASRLSG